MSRKVFVTREWPGDSVTLMTEAGLDVEVWPEQNRPPTSEIQNRIADGAFAVITTVEDPINQDILSDGAPDLQIVAQAGVGYDNLDVNGLASAGIWTSNTPGVLDDATADLAFALMCSIVRRIPEANAYVRDGKWSSWHPSLLLGMELRGATIGVVGLGESDSRSRSVVQALG